MTTVNMLEAKNSLSKLVEAVESGEEREIVIARNGKPAVRLVPLQGRKPGVRIGVARGLFEVPDNIDELNDEIAKMFYGDDDDA
ncbi:MAG TPA: type II toxin-antitoxin system prevent-host-death family antitoxin [Caulobacteraceae bacterium]|jgi:prevent-host-death family protein